MRWLLPLLGCVLALSLCGCNYSSDYQPPRDGRARPIYDDDTVVMVPPAVPFSCGPYGPQYEVQGARWVPQQIVLQAASGGSYGGGGVYISGPIFVPGPHVHASGAAFGSSSASGGGGDGGKLVAVALAVAAIVAFPIIIVGLAVGNPEQEDAVASAIDSVNQYNDQLRERAAVCAELASRRRAR
jgi:hypothetical protein